MKNVYLEVDDVDKQQLDFDLCEEQDTLIALGIKLMCQKISQLFDIVHKNGLDLDPKFKVDHKQW